MFMTILLSSPVPGVMIRWEAHLKGHCKIKKALSIEQLRSLCGNRQFDVILLHRMLIDMSSFRTLRSAFPTARFFLLTDHPDEEEALTFLRLGIVGYANTYIAAPRLLEALHVITEGGVWLGQKIIQRLITGVSNTLKPEDKKDQVSLLPANLTKSQRNIAERVARGQSNLEIAADLNITERTVKAHLTSIYEKTKTGNRLNLALLINLGKNPSG